MALKSYSSVPNISTVTTTKKEDSVHGEYAGVFKATFYDPFCDGCSGTGKTASGAKATPGVTIAVDTDYWKFGTKFYIEGYGTYIAQDTGGAIKGKNRIDICVASEEEANRLGVQKLRVWVVND